MSPPIKPEQLTLDQLAPIPKKKLKKPPITEKHKRQISAKITGRKRTPEIRARMGAAQTRRFVREREVIRQLDIIAVLIRNEAIGIKVDSATVPEDIRKLAQRVRDVPGASSALICRMNALLGEYGPRSGTIARGFARYLLKLPLWDAGEKEVK